ncbi:MAG TPA: NAD(P)/FAD-dependent oxidoreductase [Candidatus Binataceae bacterium]|nr:NAD(P)/FAD-dependent oxidoreductase [Candidatus Binataceae bacterium]
MRAYDVVIIGAGAAGLMCALSAGQRGRRVRLIEHSDQPGEKILISGGGRCNFTNLEISPERFLSANPHFCKSALSRYTQWDFIAMVERHRIAYHEKVRGQLFCDGSAREIVTMLLAECGSARVELSTGTRVTGIERTDQFRIETNRGGLTAPALIIASGGLSIPKLGATGFAYETARRFGLKLVEPRPGLVALKTGGELATLCRSLAGVSVEAGVSCGENSFNDSMLFTHRGLSGPAVLQISSYWRPGEALTLDLVPNLDGVAFVQERKRLRPKAELRSILAEAIPVRLAHAFASNFPEGPVANLPDRILAAVSDRLKRWVVQPVESEGWPKAEVTVGGIDTDELSSRTMEVRKIPRLYFIGEAVDVTGWLGGYNFQWAWSSGWAAGQFV